MDDLRGAVAARIADGEPFSAVALHPQTPVHVADPALGLPPLLAGEIDAVDGIPVVLDELLAPETVAFREPTRLS